MKPDQERLSEQAREIAGWRRKVENFRDGLNRRDAEIDDPRLSDQEIESAEKFAAEHGLAALLDHLGLDGLGNEVVSLARQLTEAKRPRYGILPFLCPICDRKRVEYEATADGKLFVRCTKCGADHDTICDAALNTGDVPTSPPKDSGEALNTGGSEESG